RRKAPQGERERPGREAHQACAGRCQPHTHRPDAPRQEDTRRQGIAQAQSRLSCVSSASVPALGAALICCGLVAFCSASPTRKKQRPVRTITLPYPPGPLLARCTKPPALGTPATEKRVARWPRAISWRLTAYSQAAPAGEENSIPSDRASPARPSKPSWTPSRKPWRSSATISLRASLGPS